jgi:N-acetylglucosaminyldiphosphoundecaprenol N-acetyl-beta-D-mannosaminyltransferase
MLEMCRMSVERGYRHFLYGGKPGVAQALADALRIKVPGVEIVGAFTPPFQELSATEEEELIAAVRETRPDILWVGLSTPKQERFMNEYLGRLDADLMVGVGAAFDIHTGKIKDAPAWMKLVGLQWAHRLAQEPRRLWRRYLINNPTFIWCIILQFFGIRKHSINY